MKINGKRYRPATIDPLTDARRRRFGTSVAAFNLGAAIATMCVAAYLDYTVLAFVAMAGAIAQGALLIRELDR